MSENRCDVLVVGAGISGLVAAFELAQHGAQVHVFEAADHVGGWIHTDRVDGLSLEMGAATFALNEAPLRALAQQLGLLDDFVPPLPQASRRWVVKNRRPIEVKLHPISLLFNPLVSLGAKLRVLRERNIPPATTDESIYDFFARRFGKGLAELAAEVLTLGVYAGDPKHLSMQASFPKLVEMEQAHGSLLRAMTALRKEAKAGRREPRVFGTLKGGMGRWTETLAERLGNERIHLGEAVSSLRPIEAGWELRTSNQRWQAPVVVVATPPSAAAQLTRAFDEDLANLLAQIRLNKLFIEYSVYPRATWPTSFEGFGMIVPRREPFPIIGSLWPTFAFAGQSPDDQVLVRHFVAMDESSPWPNRLDIDRLKQDFEGLLGMSATSLKDFERRYEAAIPQPELGHRERIESIDKQTRKSFGLFLAGNYLSDGVALDAVVARAQATARTAHLQSEEARSRTWVSS